MTKRCDSQQKEIIKATDLSTPNTPKSQKRWNFQAPKHSDTHAEKTGGYRAHETKRSLTSVIVVGRVPPRAVETRRVITHQLPTIHRVARLLVRQLLHQLERGVAVAATEIHLRQRLTIHRRTRIRRHRRFRVL